MNNFNSKFKLAMMFFLFVTGILSTAHASENFDPESIEVKARLEELIATRYKNSLAASIDRSLFEVAVRVELLPARKDKEGMPDFQKLKDSAKDLVGAEELIRLYEEQLKVAQQKNGTSDSSASNYVVKNVDVSIGLSEDLGKDYLEKTKVWLQARAAKEFGSRVTTTVQFLKPKPKILDENAEGPILKFIGKTQNLIGFLLLSLALGAGIIFWRGSVSEQEEANRKLKLQLHQSSKNSPPKSILKAESNESLFGKTISSNLNIDLELKSVKELIYKIGYLTVGLNKDIEQVISAWFEGGERDHYKIACLIDVVTAFNSGTASELNPNQRLNWTIEIPKNFISPMQTVFKKMAEMPLQVKRRLLDEIYWDLTSLRHLGVRSIYAPFGYVDLEKGEKIQGILAEASSDVRALTVLHMRPDVQNKFINNLSHEAKKALIIDSLNMVAIDQSDIEAVSEKVKFQLEKTKGPQTSVSVRPLALKLLENLSALEELEFFKGISEKLSDKGISIKQNHPSLAFISEWPEDKRHLLIQEATVEEVLSLLRVCPELKEIVLPHCRPRVTAIVEGELPRPDKLQKDEKNRHLTNLKQKLVSLIDGGQVVLGEIFKKQDHGEISAA